MYKLRTRARVWARLCRNTLSEKLCEDIKQISYPPERIRTLQNITQIFLYVLPRLIVNGFHIPQETNGFVIYRCLYY